MIDGNINDAISQLAEQLGTTADRVLALVPQYAEMQASYATWHAVAALIGVAACLAVAVTSLVLRDRAKRETLKRWQTFEWWDDATGSFTAFLCAAAAAVALACLCLSFAWDAWSWATWPESKVAEMVLRMVG